MKKTLLALCILFGGIHSCLGYIKPDPCEYALTLEWIYFHPLVDDNYFVFNSSNSDSDDRFGSRLANELSFHSGFRLEGAYGLGNGCENFQVAWTHLCTADTQKQTGQFLALTQGVPDVNQFNYLNGSASSTIEILFDRVEALFGRTLCRTCNLEILGEAGLQYSTIERKDRLSASGLNPTALVTDNYQTKADYWGIGPQLNLIGQRQCGCINIIGSASSALLLGQNESKVIANATNNADFANATSRSIWRMVPNFQARLGLDYTFCLYCVNSHIQIGYEFLTYLRVIDRVIFPDDVLDALSFDNYSNLDFHGPFISWTVRF